LVTKHYGDNNPFKQANDQVANAISDVGLTMVTGAGLGNLARGLLENGVRYIPALTGAIAGAAGGQWLTDKAVEAATGYPMDWHLEKAGMDPYGRALFKPGAWAGSIVGSAMGDGMVNNGMNWFYNSAPRMAMTPRGPVMVEPGETVTVEGSRPTGMQEGVQGNTGYKGTYTTKTGGGRGSASGQSNRVGAGQGNGHQQVPYGVQTRTMASQNSTRSGSQSYSFENGWRPYSPTTFGWMPYEGEEVPYRYVRLTPETYEEEEPINYDQDFVTWYGQQPNNTVQYFKGSEGHPAMWVQIDRSGNPPTSRTVTREATRRDVGDQQGYIIPDSSSVKEGKAEGPSLQRVSGGVPAKAKRSKKKIFD
jgi:hypothetical protein